MLTHQRFVRCDVDAVELVIADEAFNPFDVPPALPQAGFRFLRHRLLLLRRPSSGTGYTTLDHVFRHLVLLSRMFRQGPAGRRSTTSGERPSKESMASNGPQLLRG